MYYNVFTTTDCYKCKSFKTTFLSYLKFAASLDQKIKSEHIIDGKFISEQDGKIFFDLIAKYEIKIAPTIIFFNDSDIEIYRTDDALEAINFIKNNLVING